MKKLSRLLAAALIALALPFAGVSLAGHGSKHSSRVGRTDAEKVAAQRADADRWLNDERDRGDDDGRERHRELREEAWRAPAGTLVMEGGRNGGVIVTGWSRDSLRVIARVDAQARTVARAREIARAVSIVNEGGRLTAEGPRTDEDESWCVTFDVLAPRTRGLEVEAHNGPVMVADMDSKMLLETVNGPLALAGLAGDVRARAQNGPLTVSLTGKSWRGAGLDAATQNGPVSVHLPRGYSCMLETGTINGPMNVNIPITIQGRINVRHEHVTAKLGSGGAKVRAVTTNGPAVVGYLGEREVSQ